ncbi:unnamed protein product [Paramecium pentaurelia]|uniref:Cytosolic carboxypeptidase-like protein 5 n=1 Tax=Paramecium pentaurelia TaxID=43138 RepID=A0A8S1TX08_9CILI|nr:unnamed protein product [Paramecium pentaurelia]
MNNLEYPSQITQTINGITFSSAFDSGNLKSVIEQDGKYILQISSDQGINGKITNYRTWFYFSVSVISEGVNTFVISNMQNQMGLFKDGMQPVFRSSNSLQWDRIKQPCQYRLVSERQFEITFQHIFLNNETVYFAFFHPWSCQDNENFLQHCQSISQQIPNIYFDNSILSYSKEGRPINLITITNGSSEKLEEPLQGIFPITIPYVFNKPHIFISARVHPGEVPSSFVHNGLIKYLLTPNDPVAKAARDNYVWCFVPIINPDGVYRGHYRTDSLCQNLNRYYLSPSQEDHPTIYAIKEYLIRLHQTGRFLGYIDLHAHASQKGAFIYGNQLNQLSQQISNCIIPKLITLYSQIFDYDACNFTEKNMYAADKGDGLSKEGSGRVALHKICGIIHSYTLECNYNIGKLTNFTYEESEDNSYKENNLEENIILGTLDTTKPISKFFTIEDYEQVGVGIVNAFLDYNLLNPRSKITESPFKTLANLKTYLAFNMIKYTNFRFDPYIKKILKYINNKEQIPRVLKAFYDYICSGQIQDYLEGNPENPTQKPLTRYEKAQEIKREKEKKQQQLQQQQQQEPLQQQQQTSQELQQQEELSQQQEILQQQESLQIPIKQQSCSNTDLDSQQNRVFSLSKAESELQELQQTKITENVKD